MKSGNRVTRREAISTLAVAVGGLAMAGEANSEMAGGGQDGAKAKGQLKHSVCKWCYPKIALEDLCAKGNDLGLVSVELLSEGDWATCAKHGLTCAVANGPSGITD